MNFTADTCLKNGTCNQHCNQGRACPRVALWAAQKLQTDTTSEGLMRITPLPAKVITLATPTGNSAEQVVSKTATTGQGAKAAHVGNVRAIHPHLHERDDAWLTTPGQLQRTEDERTGRAATVLEYFAIGFAVVFTVLISAIGGIAIYAMWGDAIFSGIGNAASAAWQFITSPLLVWGRVWT